MRCIDCGQTTGRAPQAKRCASCLARDTKACSIAAIERRSEARRAARESMRCLDCTGPIVGRKADALRCAPCAKKKRTAEQVARYWQSPEKYREITRNHPERGARLRAWRARRADHVRSAKRAYDNARYRENPLPVLLAQHKRRARLLDGASPGVTAAEWRVILATYLHRCAYCAADGPMTVDHVVPIARGGRDEPENVVPACRPCNSSKCDRLFIVEWRERYRAVA